MVCDDKLAKKALAGDEQAFRAMVEKYKAYVFAIILNFIKDYDEVENVAQEVFMQIYLSLPQYRFKNLKAWIGKIAATKAIDWKRKKSKSSCEEMVESIECFGNAPDRVSETPEEILLKREHREQIFKVCDNMPEIYGSVIVKFYFEGKSYQQIALEEKMSSKTVESRLYRARRLFREKWRENH